ncbi:MAG: DUF4445 domain-containing protein [Planctomycetes bacterium]|nr:DUF4445 domain-containing protein [Planctomycetota bacterium]
MKTYKITFLPDNKTVIAQAGSTILETAQKSGIYITGVCGGDVVCGKCRVIIKSGKVKTEPTGLLTPQEIKEGVVLACYSNVIEDIVVEIPPESRAEEGEVLLKGKAFRKTSCQKSSVKGDYGLAVDIGTTTVVAYLINQSSGKTLGAMGAFNRQITYGDDIITRIIFAGEKGGMEKLHQAVIGNINNLITALAFESKIKPDDIKSITVAGNTTMIHLLMKQDPGYLRREPYLPKSKRVEPIRASELGIKINPKGLLSCVPNVSSYVGGDVIAGLVACGMAEKDELALYVDMGTNGEMVLGNKEWLASVACSVGPAFEGSGIKSGTRAVKGAIDDVSINKSGCKALVRTIGKGKPKGICGSGLIELISEMLKARIINKAGKISTDIKSPFIRKGDEGTEYVVVPAKDSLSGRDIVITQPDIDNIIRSKAAVYAGARTLLNKMNLTFKDIKRFYIAGAFGSHLDIEKSIAIGMLPDITRSKFKYIGNGSVAGASMILLDKSCMEKAEELADKMAYVDLSGDNIFHEEFISAMFLPHTDIKLFQSLRG